MIVWLSIFLEIRWMVVYRSGQIEDMLWRIYCPKRGKLAGLGQTYSYKPSQHFKNYAENSSGYCSST